MGYKSLLPCMEHMRHKINVTCDNKIDPMCEQGK